MTPQEFNTAFHPFLDYFPTGEMTKEKNNIYYLALSHLSTEQLTHAFINMIKNRVYKNFPQVAEIIQYALGTTENTLNSRIVIAKEVLKKAIVKYGAYGSVQFEDLGIHAVIDSLGGWQKLCLMSESEFQKFMTFEFQKVYKAFIEFPYKVSTHYIGYFDQQNKSININYIGAKENRLITNKQPQNEILSISEVQF